jgi:hypothetical protein
MTMYVARADHRTITAWQQVILLRGLTAYATQPQPQNYPQITQMDADMGKENALSAGVFCSFGAFTTIDSSGQSALNCVFCGQKLRSTGASEPL